MMLSDLAQAKKLFPWGLFKRSPLCYISFKSQFSSVKSELGANIAVKNMKDEPLVSILINNYNYGRFLENAIESVLNQTYRNIEIIIVDDGSTDKSRQILEGYANNNLIKVVLKDNGGQASAFNSGFKYSKGDIICFLDADDIFHPQKVHFVVRSFSRLDQELGWLFHFLDFFNDKIQADKLYDKLEVNTNHENVKVYDLRSVIRRGKLSGHIPSHLNTATSGICYKRELLAQILPMPESIRITSDDYLKYASIGISPGIITSQKLAFQRIHDNNAYTLRPKSKLLKAKIQIITAYSLFENFSELKKFSNNLFSMGIYLLQCTKAMDEVSEDEVSEEMIRDYLSRLSIYDQFLIKVKILYYRYIYSLPK